MTKSEAVEAAARAVYGAPLVRGPDTYGCSEVGFCMEKIVLRVRTQKDQAVNGDMVIGKLYHLNLKQLVAKTEHGQIPKWKFWLQPKFEQDVYFSDPRGFKIHGHCDIDLPAADRIIEAKTTGGQRAWAIGEDFLTDAYVYQANAYATILGRKHWELWILYKNFDSIHEERFVTVLEGDTSPELFTEFLERVANIHQAIQSGKDLMGPEQNWECKGCSYVTDCPYWREILPRFEKSLPNTKNILTQDADMAKAFSLFYEKGWIVYDRSAKVYRRKTKEDSPEVDSNVRN
jgi:CRISPR/Cas system-associated exonuclease Cas4 (RecB family)